MEKARRDKRKEVQTRLNFGENPKRTRREREHSLNSRAENSPARFHPEKPRTQRREERNDRNVFSRLSHRRKSIHERLSEVALIEAIPALGNAPEQKIVPVTRKNRMAIRTPRELQLSTEIDPAMYKGRGKVNPHHPTDRKAAPTRSRLESNITYRPRTSVKGQILADFLVEKLDENTSNTSVVETPPEPWTLFTDGSSCVDGSGSEYEALIAGLRIVAQMGVQNVQVNVDSKLVANQVLGTYVAKEENMIKYLEKVKGLVSGFANFSINQVPRSKNKKADALSKIASTSFAHLSEQVLVEVLQEKSIQEKEVTTMVEEDGPTWMTPILEYLKDGTLPEDKKEVSKLCIKARQYELMEGILYKRSFLKPWLRCAGPLQANYVIREIHEGSCSMHAGPRSVVAKAIRLGYYWPSMHQDAREMIRACNDCQAHRTMIKSSHGDTPFSLTYGTEVVIPAEIGMPTCRTATVDTIHNDEELRLNLDLLEERRECA
ncbi:reverse transcriptase domain-containing protein [Tanacetum coccineum]